MANKPVSKHQQEAYDRLLATHPQVERKGKNIPYTAVNGNMFTVFSDRAQLGIRLPKPEREAFIVEFNTSLLASYGAVMKEYVAIPDALLADTDTLEPYLRISYEYVTSLKPKPTKKPKK